MTQVTKMIRKNSSKDSLTLVDTQGGQGEGKGVYNRSPDDDNLKNLVNEKKNQKV
jgi:hypothetical protein